LEDRNVFEELRQLLGDLGVRTSDERGQATVVGFPATVPLANGQTLVLDLPSPWALSSLDPNSIGVAILDPLGNLREAWGLAKKVPFFRTGINLLDGDLGPLLSGSYQGTYGSLYLDGYRYFSGALSSKSAVEVVVLVVNAQEERHAKRQANKSWRMANALKRLGKALTMNQQIQPLGVSAVHEIASAAELAAVLLWTHNMEREMLTLTASVGANRQAMRVLEILAVEGGASCVAELVADSREHFFCPDVRDGIITAGLEAKFCYLKPGSVSVHPLVISDRLVGVLELVGRDGDPHFQENLELFETITEHLALALNSAMLFEHFEQWATHDALTGIANHRHLHEFLHQRVHEAERNKQEVGVLMIDVDHFRAFNEEEGHDAGDEVLRLVADALKHCIRPYDLAARYGGEEFTVVMPGSNVATAMSIAARIRERVQETSYMTRQGRERHVTVSIGCALYPETAEDVSGLIKAADAALYEAKRAGRNRTVLYNGRFVAKPRYEGRLEKIGRWVAEEDRPEAERLLSLLTPMVIEMARTLPLSTSQHEILRALLWIAPTYRRIREADPEALKALDAAEEFRALLPSLQSLDERFDGTGRLRTKGPRIPLLGRILAVLLAYADPHSNELIEDRSRFDPEIVTVVTDARRAA